MRFDNQERRPLRAHALRRSSISGSAVTLLLIASAHGTAHGQSEADSLWNVWHDASQHDTARMRAMDHLAFDHYLFTQPDSAYLLASELLLLAESTGNAYFTAIGFNTRGASLQIRGDFPGAIEQYILALGQLKLLGDHRRQTIAHNNVGSILHDLGEADKALAHYDTCVGLSIRTGNETALADALLNSAAIIRERGDTSEALSRYQRSLELTDRLGIERSTALNHGNIGRILSHRGEHATAMVHLEQALTIAGTLQDRRLMSMFNREVGEALARQGRIREAIAAGERSLAICRPARMAVEVHGTALMLYRNYKRLGDLPKALAMHELFAAMADTLHNEKGREEMVRANVRFNFRQQALADSLAHVAELERLDSDRVLAQVRVRNQRRLFLGGTMMLLGVGGAATWSYVDRRQRRAWYEREQAIQLERMRIASDMHDDLGSGLSALRMRGELAQRGGADPETRRHLASITEQAVELIGNMRQIIWAMHTDQSDLASTLDHCVDHARRYLIEHGLALDLERADGMPGIMLTPRQRRNIFLLLKEALHNIVKHAGASRVRLEMAWAHGLVVRIQDDGRGMPAELSTDGGRGLVNMADRMKELGGTFTWRNADGLEIEARIPLGGEGRHGPERPPNEHAIAGV